MIGPIDRLAWQDPIFAERLNRFYLMKLGAKAGDDAPALVVLRNHAFETVASALPAFNAFAGLDLRPVYSDYDDSLPLPVQAGAAVLVWMDFGRLAGPDDETLARWVVSRLDQVRARAKGPLIVANAPDADPRAEFLNAALRAWADATPGAALLRLDELARDLGPAFFDPARAAATGSRYSDQAMLQSARRLGLELLPAALAPPLKAIAIDLDNTVYGGVLGEDGPSGVVLTQGHAALQAELARRAAQGVLLAVVSRNLPADVEQLFSERGDFLLGSEMIASWQAGWGDKSESIAAAAEAFNIAPDSFLFVDDNAGELVEAAQAHPRLALLFAGSDPARTAAALRRYPGLPRDAKAFAGRVQDIRANRQREGLALAAADDEAYLRALQPVLTFALDPRADRARLADLSAKTNQFNLALGRFDEVEVERYLALPERAVVHVRLSDRLADSGSIAAIFMRREVETIVVDELCISCRALGRRLETLIVGEAVRRGQQALGGRNLAFVHALGPKNAPARDWLAARLGRALPAEAGRVDAAFASLAAAASGMVQLLWTDEPAETASAQKSEA